MLDLPFPETIFLLFRFSPSGQDSGQSQVVLLSQSASDFLIGSEEDETARADEGHPRYAASKQTGERGESNMCFLKKDIFAAFVKFEVQ